MSVDHRLATYGTLMPGERNHGQMDGMAGRWRRGRVRGRLVPEGWGASLGFPALVLDPAGAAVPVRLFESADLPAHWPRLDAFEGEGYRRVAAAVKLDADEGGGTVEAWIYVGAGAAPG